MLISESKQFLFVHVQKTAGSSIRRVLEPYALRPSRSLLNKLLSRLRWQRDYRRFYLRPHARISLIEEIMPAEVFQRLFKIAFVRNPWDRLVSWYSYIIQNPDHRRHARIKKLPSFEAYLWFEMQRNKISQFDMLKGRDGTLKADFVGRFEHLRGDFSSLLDRLGIEAELPHERVSRHRAYQTYYTPESAELVRQHWRDDVETFAYEFEGTPGEPPG